MTPLRQRYVEDLQVRNYSPRTVECYVYHVACFAKHFGRSPEQLGPEEVHAYQVYLVREKKASWCSFNQAVCALRFLYRTTLPRPWPVSMIPFGKRPKKLPTVLGPDEVQKLLGMRHTAQTTHGADDALCRGPAAAGSHATAARRTSTAPACCCGWPAAREPRSGWCPSRRALLTELRDYWRTYRPTTWLFPGTKPEQPHQLGHDPEVLYPRRRRQRA